MSVNVEQPTDEAVNDLAWLVWFARKSKGKAEDVARLAWAQNPALRLDHFAQAEVERGRLIDAAREVVRFYGTDRTWSLTYRTLLGSRIDDLEAALAEATR